jgi:hypothetical protein
MMLKIVENMLQQPETLHIHYLESIVAVFNRMTLSL